jgi:hypothetical protein
MLRTLYRCVLRLHPSGFRKRFEAEILSIFDHTSEGWATARLLADGLLSFLRQWTLRPEFWHECATAQQPASDGIPSFCTLAPFRPSASAIIHGLVLSIAVFCLTCFGIRYSWIHVLHVRIPEVVFDSPRFMGANASGAAREGIAKAAVPPRQENNMPVPAPAGRSTSAVPARAIVSPLTVANGVPTTAASRSLDVDGTPTRLIVTTPVTQALLQSYVGEYVSDSPGHLAISISEEGGHLTMAIAGQPKRDLVPVSETEFAVREIENCWIIFLPADDDAHRNDLSHWEIQIFQSGQYLSARRK